MDDDHGLKRSLRDGEAVILSTGATATVRGSYSAGYTGDVNIVLDGRDEKERASGLTLPDETFPPPVDFEVADAIAEQDDIGGNRARSREMKD